MTETPAAPPPASVPEPTTIPTTELVEGTTKMVADIVREVLDAEGVRWIKGIVTDTYEEGPYRFVNIKRPENELEDAKPYPVVHVATKPVVGEYVHALQVPGGVIILGPDQKTSDLTVENANSRANEAYNKADHNHPYADSNHGHKQGDNNMTGFSAAGHSHDANDLPGAIIYASEVKQDADGYLFWVG
jgi:hypothetical protein